MDTLWNDQWQTEIQTGIMKESARRESGREMFIALTMKQVLSETRTKHGLMNLTRERPNERTIEMNEQTNEMFVLSWLAKNGSPVCGADSNYTLKL